MYFRKKIYVYIKNILEIVPDRLNNELHITYVNNVPYSGLLCSVNIKKHKQLVKTILSSHFDIFHEKKLKILVVESQKVKKIIKLCEIA